MKFLSSQIAINSLIAIFFTVLSLQNTVFAQQTDNQILQNDSLKTVVISSNYLKSSEVIIPTTELKQENFDRHSPKDLVNVMNQTAGVFIQQGAINTNRITIRGVGSRTLYGTNKIRAYFNGIPITNGVSETVINIFNPEDLESVEIVKGAKATQYGTNLGGTILLNSKTPQNSENRIENKNTASIVNSFIFGSFGFMKNTVGINYGSKKFSLHFNYDRLEQEGYRENSNFDKKNYFLLPTFHISKKTEISLLLNYIDYFGQIPSSISKTDFEENPKKAAFTWQQAKGYEDQKQLLSAITLTHRFNSTFSNTTSIFYNKTENYEPRPFNILTEDTNGLGTRTLFAISLPSFFNAEISTGTEIYYDNYDWKTYQNLYQQNNGKGSLEGNNLSKNLEKRWNYSVFATTILELSEKLSSQIGINFNHTYYDYQNKLSSSDSINANRNFEPILAPNFSLTYSFTAQKSMYANVSRGFNYPSLEETLTPNGLVNPKITAEKGWNYEIGTDSYFFKNNNLHFNLSAYILQINGLLVAKRVNEDQYIGRNAGKTSHKGIELSSDYNLKLSKNWFLQFFANGTLNFHKFVDFIDEESDSDFSGNELTGVPDKQLYSGFSFKRVVKKNTNFAFHFIYQHVGAMPMNDANSLYSEAYNLFNLKVDYQISLLNAIFVKASLGVDNLLNEKYASSILINAIGFGNNEPRFYYSGLPINYFGNLRFEYVF